MFGCVRAQEQLDAVQCESKKCTPLGFSDNLFSNGVIFKAKFYIPILCLYALVCVFVVAKILLNYL